MKKIKFSNGRISLLPREYGTFREYIYKFFKDEVLPYSKKILDPMAGTAPFVPLIETSGKKACFNDILPIHYFLNKAKTYRCYKIFKDKEEKKSNYFINELYRYLKPLNKKKLLISQKWIHEDILDILVNAWHSADDYEEEIETILKSIIILCIRPYSCNTPSVSNFTWLKEGGMSTGRELREIIIEMVSKLTSFYKINYSDKSIKKVGRCSFCHIDAENIKLHSRFDVIFTSPPYANRYDPIIFYGPELYFLSKVNHKINKFTLIGSPKIKDYYQYEDDLDFIRKASKSTHRFIKAVIEKSEEKSNYYARIFINYYSKLFRIIYSLTKLLIPEGKFYLVVQNNIHRGELNAMDLFLIEYFKYIGFKANIVRKKVQTHLGKRNISAKYPLVIKKHLECIIEAKKCS